jgi:hypothetical protein
MGIALFLWYFVHYSKKNTVENSKTLVGLDGARSNTNSITLCLRAVTLLDG